MKALVTGATGLIGQAVVTHLLAAGVAVRATGRREPRFAREGRLEFMPADIQDEAAVARAVEGCTHIFHLAAQVSHEQGRRESIWPVNVQGTANVIRAAKLHRVCRLVYASSVSVYGRGLARHGIHEATSPAPDSLYGRSKIAAEELLQQEPDLPFVIARLGAVMGPGARAYADLFRKIAEGRLRMIGKGAGMQTLVSVNDVARGLVLCGTTPGVEKRTYVIAGAEAVPFGEFIAEVSRATGGPPLPPPIPELPVLALRKLDRVLFRVAGLRVPRADRLDLFLSDRTYDISRARRELGYEPEAGIREIVQQAVDWMRAEQLLPDGCRQPTPTAAR